MAVSSRLLCGGVRHENLKPGKWESYKTRSSVKKKKEEIRPALLWGGGGLNVSFRGKREKSKSGGIKSRRGVRLLWGFFDYWEGTLTTN